MVLNKKEIEKLIKEKALVEDYVDLETQVTPNGFDLTVRAISEFDSAGALDFSNKERKTPQGKEVIAQKQQPQDRFGWWELKRGAYKIASNEIVNLPKNLIAMAFPRSSLLRMGAFSQNGVWDAGFQGRSEFILVVENPHGIKIKQNARLIQLVFISIDEVDKGYSGIYQNNHQK
ncbi:MAG: deoxyuridine 5'-triphosphate nucleotidohydrolase [Candidatus Omnitrophica bacterium]|nr:deoxyuridine 5'-triphosphate nucleotidohydrolase [Candidatus Omnitrophota bacterium]MDD5236064.1 deoxyuridine 5'-triphosphate nucleotidohydrolase [Candidatus Omnitrophota bacterium]MDD5609938.1 deoxyuridine 5'-triphosphate nucleotidohydrolase [Candidatus Omnitrophota bacterium]